VSLDDRIQERIETLLEYPLAGRSGRLEGTRELVIADTPYIAVYRIANDTIRILRILHGARQWPDQISDL
jgi:toxin ParE1/3/4